ncbi:MAG: response regulator [Candidatus Acidiferrales bacterium]
MRKFRHSGKLNDHGTHSEAEPISFSGGVIADEIEIDGTDGPSGAYAPDTAALEHPSEASGVIIVGGSMPEVEVEDSHAASAQESATPHAQPSNGNNANHEGHHSAQSHSKSDHGHKSRPSGEDRRKRRRALISAPVRVRPVHITDDGPSEITTTVDVSRSGLLFASQLSTYKNGMEVAVVFPYSAIPGEVYAEQIGRVVRHVTLADGRKGVAICFEKAAVGEESLVDSGGRSFAQEKTVVAPITPGDVLTPAEQTRAKILVVESDERARTTMCSYLNNDGYSAMGVGSAAEAREVLSTMVPAVVVAEIEGDGMHGYDLCTSIKKDERLRGVPVILTTRSAYPSDYANAHAVGAIICMAKPFKQEKLGHMVRLLAPLRKKAHLMRTDVEDAETAKARKILYPSHRTSTKPKMKYNRDEFSKLCDDAVREKNKLDNGDRFDANDGAAAASTVKESKQSEPLTGLKALRHRAVSLFKR